MYVDRKPKKYFARKHQKYFCEHVKKSDGPCTYFRL